MIAHDLHQRSWIVTVKYLLGPIHYVLNGLTSRMVSYAKFKILNSIIITFAILVMHRLAWKQSAFKMYSHHETVL